jgi:hypothetical protein
LGLGDARGAPCNVNGSPSEAGSPTAVTDPQFHA